MASPSRENVYLTTPNACHTEATAELPLVTFLGHAITLRALLAAAGGAVVGIIVSLVVNVALVELSVSPFFAVYFAMLSILVGGIILWRVTRGESPDPNESHRKELAAFSYVVMLSGIMSFFLTNSWFVSLPSLVKIPVYTLLGVSVAFALTFTLVDVLNLVVGLFQSAPAKPVVQSITQIRLIVAMAVLMGGIFGFIFGLLDVEDTVTSYVRLAMMREEHYCYPIGAVVGALTGFATEYTRKAESAWQRLRLSEFDDDI